MVAQVVGALAVNGWLKLYNHIIDDPKIRAIAPGDRWHFVAILCLKNNGTLDEPDELRDELVAISLGLQIDEVEALHKRLIRWRLVDANWQPLNWSKLQQAQDKTGAERQRRFREKQAESKAVAEQALRNALPVTKQPLPEVEREEEKEKNTSARGAGLTDVFESWWKTYPRKKGKADALAAFKKLKAFERDAMLADDLATRYSDTEEQFIPHGSTYVRKKAWLDDLPRRANQHRRSW